jgi:biotin transporter BioY
MKRVAFLIVAVMASALAAVGQTESIECGPVDLQLQESLVPLAALL